MTPATGNLESSNVTRLVIVLYLIFLTWLIAHLHSRGWTGIVVGYPFYDDNSLLSIPFTPGAELSKYTDTVTALTPMRQYAPSFPGNEQVYPLRRPKVGWRLESALTPSAGHYAPLTTDQTRTGDVVYVVAGPKGAILLPVESPFSRLPLAILICAALLVSLASVSVGALIVAQHRQTLSAILLGLLAIAVGIMLSSTVYALFEFWRGIGAAFTVTLFIPYVVASLCLLLSGSLILHFCYVWPQAQVSHPWSRLALAYWLPFIVITTPFLLIPISPLVDWLAGHGLHYAPSLIALSLASTAGILMIILRRLRNLLPTWIYRGTIMASGLVAGSCLIDSAIVAWSTDGFDDAAIFVLGGLASLTVLSQLLGGAAKVAHVYRRAPIEAKRQLKAVVIGLLCLTAALILTLLNGGALFSQTAFIVQSSLAVALLAAFPWCLRLAVDRFHLLGVERVFPRAAATFQGVIGYAIGEVGKDFIREMLQERVGGGLGGFMYFALRVTLCLVAARIPIGDWLLRSGRLSSALEAGEAGHGILDQLLAAPTVHDALEIAATRLCQILACEGFAIYVAVDTGRPLTFLMASGRPMQELAKLEFSRRGGRPGGLLGFHNVHSSGVRGQEGRQLKAVGARCLLGVGEKNARRALILFFGARQGNVPSADMAAVFATSSVLEVRLRALA